VISEAAKLQKPQQYQTLVGLASYHREIGREATAEETANRAADLSYHREIGREATAP
jgi:hypothetical protein